MSKEKNFFNELFTSKASPYGKNPLKLISDFSDSFPKQYPILDLGGGDGRNAIYLAQKGFRVCIIDFSQAALESAKKRAELLKVAHLIEFTEADLNEFNFPDSKIGGVVCSYTLHFLENDKACDILMQAKEWPVDGGLHLIEGFLPGGTITRAVNQSEISQIYNDWQILQFETKQVKLLQKGPGGETLYNKAFQLAAKSKLLAAPTLTV